MMIIHIIYCSDAYILVLIIYRFNINKNSAR